MAKDHSFDIVSEVDLQEMTNAVEQTKKEIGTRYDFRGSNSSMSWNRDEKKVEIKTESDFRLRSIIDILQTKCIRRGVSIKNLEYKPVEKAAGGTVRQTIEIRQGIPTDKAKIIVKYIKETKIKVQSSIQSDQVRIQSSKIDNLQEIMLIVKKKDFGLELQFTNYR